MLHLREFEIFAEENGFVAIPFGMEGATQGGTFKEACAMAAEWLQLEMEWRAMEREETPDATLGNEPQHGGKVVIVAVNAGIDTIPRMTAAEAARRLGVTRGRVSQMVSAGQLDTFKLDGRTWVTQYSVDARLAERSRKAGRPRKDRAEA